MRSRTASEFPLRRSMTRKPVKKRFRLCPLLLFALAIALSLHQIQHWLHRPQAILVLGGSPEREVFAADFAREHPNLPIWVSSGSPRDYSKAVFADAAIAPDRLHLDYAAVDTVTNFTTLVDQFKAQGIDSIYLITSDYHMRRARIIGMVVLGSRGVDFRPVAIPTDQPPESIEKAVRDGARAILWVITGQTGAEIGEFLSRHR